MFATQRAVLLARIAVKPSKRTAFSRSYNECKLKRLAQALSHLREFRDTSEEYRLQLVKDVPLPLVFPKPFFHFTEAGFSLPAGGNKKIWVDRPSLFVQNAHWFSFRLEFIAVEHPFPFGDTSRSDYSCSPNNRTQLLLVTSEVSGAMEFYVNSSLCLTFSQFPCEWTLRKHTWEKLALKFQSLQESKA